MVRHKSRWLLVHFQLEDNVKESMVDTTRADSNKKTILTPKTVQRGLLKSLQKCFGVVAGSRNHDVQGETQ